MDFISIVIFMYVSWDKYLYVTPTCRDLVSGVETLKNVAEILEFIDRISEAKRT